MPISNTDDTIDSRDVISGIDEIESDIECKQDDYNENGEQIDDKENELSELRERLDDLDEVKNAGEISRINNLINDIRVDVKFLTDINSSIKNDIIDINEELKPLKEMADYAENYAPDWCHGATLIHEDYFTEYAKEFVEECESNMKVPFYVEIDWEATADNMKMDYTSVEYDGATYYIR